MSIYRKTKRFPEVSLLLEFIHTTIFTTYAMMDATSRTSLDSAGASFGVLTKWALRTPTNYGTTIVLLFVLGIIGRYLRALKWQLERSWRLARKDMNRAHNDHIDYHEVNMETDPLSPDESLTNFEKRMDAKHFWVADQHRDMKQDAIRALLEIFRAVIAYVL